MNSKQDPKNNKIKIAIVHDWLNTYAGAEKVLEQFLDIWPEADIFSVIDFLNDQDRLKLKGKIAKTTFIQKLPWAKNKYRNYLPLMPFAIEQLDLSDYDIVISSSHAVAKGVITGPSQLHISYVHSPIRYAWDLQHQYLEEAGLTRGLKGFIVKSILHYIRMWDLRTVNGVDAFISNSNFIGKRIKKFYRRESTTIYPPVDINRFVVKSPKDDFYFTASRMVPYKKIPLIVEAFSKMPDKKLIVVGDGPEFLKAKELATSNVTLLGYQSNEILIDHMQRAKAFVFAAEEDFGITPVEAQACGTPVIAYGKGGALETVIEDDDITKRTGFFYYQQTVDSIIHAVELFEKDEIGFSPETCRKHAESFSPEQFKEDIAKFVDRQWSDFIK